MSEPISPETHVFKDGNVVLNKDGTPKKKPGRKAKNAAASPPAPAPAPEQALAPAPAPEPKAEQTPVPVVAVSAVVAAPVAVVKEVAPPPVTVVEPTPVVVAGEPPKKAPPAAPSLPVTVVAAPAMPPPKKTEHKQETTATVSKSYGKIGATEDSQETLSVKTFVTHPATIEMGYGLTLNIGNYESARVDVKLSVPCYREEVDAAYEWARTWAEERIKREVKEIRAMAAPARSNPF